MNPSQSAPASPPPPGSRRTRAKVILAIAAAAALVVVGVVVLGGASSSSAAATGPATPPTVAVSVPLARTIEPRLEFLGQMSAVEDVEIRAQVGGTLTAIRFKDGDVVQKGTVLFEIDKTPYDIKFSQARAQLEAAKARVALANRQLTRATQLHSTDAGSVEGVDQATAEHLAAQAAVEGAEAMVRDAKFDLDRCTIVAPFTGRVGTHLVSVGNLIAGNRAGSGPTTLLAKMVSLDPIYVNFDLGENDYLTFMQQRQKGAMDNTVSIALSTDTSFARTGQMTFIDNALDHTSGTIHARATIANPDHVLTPGGFARVRLAVGHDVPVLLVPDAVVVADQSDHNVLVVGAGDVVAVKKVEVGDLRGGLRVIRSGLAPTDRVIVSGLGGAAVGAKVTPTPGAIRFDPNQDRI